MINRVSTALINYLGKFQRILTFFRKFPFLRDILLEKDQLKVVGEQFQIAKEQLQAKIDALEKEKEVYKEWTHFLLRQKQHKSQHKIATIINYCTTDYRFITHCINAVKGFSSQIIIPITDQFFDGTPENMDLLQKTFENNPDVTFVKFEFDPNKPVYGTQYWITFSRWIGFLEIKDDIEFVLFLDADEILEGNKFLEWLNNFNYKDYNAMFFTSYWYFRETKFRATSTEIQGLLVKKSLVKKNLLMHEGDRMGFYVNLPEKKILTITGLDENPMLHHYSWVRTKEEMLKKVTTWGHNKERDWIELVETEFQREFTVDSTDFVHGYKFKIVKPYLVL